MKKTRKQGTNLSSKKKKRFSTLKKNHAPRGDRQKQGKEIPRTQSASSIKFPIYGLHAARETWLNPRRQIHDLYLTEAGKNSFEDTVRRAVKEGLKRPEPKIIEKAILDHMLPQGAVHQGIAISCTPLAELSAKDLSIRAANNDNSKEQKRNVLLMLDQVTDPHNVGAILRSACAFGARGVIMQRKHAPELSGVLAKIATGAVEHLPIAQETNLSRALKTLKEEGYFIIGLDEHDHNTIQNVIANSLPDKIVLVLGSEGDGIRRLVKENCDIIACLPTHKPIESLNVSNAAAVALFQMSQG
jgi:23S rRNA (guanosine2251-2'-O)-methyltransferase